MSNIKNNISIGNNRQGLREALEDLQGRSQPTRPIGTIIDQVTSYRDSLIESLADADNLLERLRTLTYKKGDLAFHKTLGICVVQDISVGDGMYFERSQPGYNNITVKIGHSDGTARCAPEDLVLRNDLSESIYGR